MANVSMGDMALSTLLRRHNLDLRQDITRLSDELTTGRVSDIAKRTSGDLVPLAGLDATLSRLQGYAAITTEAGLYAGAMQTAISTIQSMATNLSSAFLAASTGTSALQINSVAKDAAQKFAATVAIMNSNVGDRSLFAGVATDSPAVTDAETLLLALEVAVTGTTSAADFQTAVDDWFDSPAGFGAAGYLGGPPLAAVPVSNAESVALDVTAADPAFRKSLAAFALGALLDRGAFAGQPATRLDLAKATGMALLVSQDDRTDVAARLGLAEASLDAAATRNTTERTSLEIARNGITSVDPFEAASKLQETQTQLEMIYSLTARMSRLSLLDYMR